MPIHKTVNGSILEGGGQLVRLTVALSVLTGTPVSITNIRGGRPRGGGLKSQHITSIAWLADVCHAHVEGLKIGSRDLVFIPGQGGADLLKGGEAFIKGDNPGSVSAISLVLQAILPVLLLSTNLRTSSSTSTPPGTPPPQPATFKITIQGGTNVSFSPSIDYISQVLVPNLALCGVSGLQVLQSNIRRGWSHGRTEPGSASFVIQPLAHGTSISGAVIEQTVSLSTVLGACQSRAERITITFLCSGTIRELDCLTEVVLPAIRAHFPTVADIEVVLDEDSGHEKRLYLLLVAHTALGFRLGADGLYDKKLPGTKDSNRRENISRAVLKFTERIAASLVQDLATGCVDRYFEDQVVVFQGLADGKSWLDCDARPEPSLHTLTARWIVGKMLPMRFSNSGVCTGASYVVGETKNERTSGERLFGSSGE